jgi:addiction module RelE/StbE family toxin
MREVKYTTRFQRDCKREKSVRHSKKLDALLMEVVNMLAANRPLPRRNFDHPLSGEWNDHRDCQRNQNHMTRESSESLASTKSSFTNSGNRKGGNSWYFQTGSVVRPLHIPKSQAFRNSGLPFTACSLVPARSMFSHRFPRRLRRPLGQPGRHCPVFR